MKEKGLLQIIISIILILLDIGCVLAIQEQMRMIPREILINLLQMHKEIHEETQAAIDAEVSDNEDDDI